MSTVPIEIDPDAARDAAARELADPAYQNAEPSLVERIFDRIGRFLADLLSGVGGSVAGGLLVLLILLAVVIVVVRLRVGRLARNARADRSVFAGTSRSADDHRRAADEAYERGDLAGAIRERFRAVVRELERRGVLDERSGRTVDEIAAQAGDRLPHNRTGLRRAATIFDDIVYGDHRPTEAAYHELTTLDAGMAVR
jgi:hypothetical protein